MLNFKVIFYLSKGNSEFLDDQKILIVKAHKSTLSSLELNSSGTLLATASEKGTIIRVYNIKDVKEA